MPERIGIEIIMDWKIITVALAAWNLIVFALYGIDKRKAKRKERRVSEQTLLLLAALMGAPGAFLGMRVFRHKTKHTKFKIGVPLLLVLNITAALCIWHYGGFMDKPAMYTKITAEDAKAMMEDKSAVILDVRTEEEFAEAHIEGAVLIPDTELGKRAITELPDKKAVILIYCRSGRRSELAANELIGLGYRNVYDFGGIIDWPYEIFVDGE